MTDVARQAGVSTMTVSRVYKQPDRVSAKTRQRVLAIAERLGYVPNLVAANLSSGRGNVIAAIVPSFSNSYFAATLQGMADELRRNGYEMMLADSGYRPEEEERVVAAFLGRRPEGIMLVGTRHTRATRSMLRGAGIPAVETWETKGPFIDMAIGYSHYDASRALTQLLIGQGHAAIGYIDHPQAAVQRHLERGTGIADALKAAGLRSDIVIRLPSVGGFSAGRQGLQQLLAQYPETTAVICATDIYAAGALFECQHRGIAVPAQLAVCGFGNFEIATELCPPLTSVDTHAYEIGRGASEMLLCRIAGQPVTPRIRDVGYAIVTRQSTGHR